MRFTDKLLGKKETNSQSTSMENKRSWYDDLPFDYLTVDRFFKDEASFYNNVPIPQVLRHRVEQLEEALEYIDANLDDPNLSLDIKARLIQKMGKELSDFYHLAYIHEVLNDDKKEKGLADMGLRILKDAYRVTTSYMRKSGIDIPLHYFHTHIYNLNMSIMTYISQIANINAVIVPNLIVKYVQAVEKLASSYISDIEKKNQQLQHENDEIRATIKELSANEEYNKIVVLQQMIEERLSNIECLE